jgi:hypothetical protein
MKEFDFLPELWGRDGETSDGEDNINIGNTELTFYREALSNFYTNEFDEEHEYSSRNCTISLEDIR